MVNRQMPGLSSKIGFDAQPIYTSKKLEQDLKLKEIKPRIVNQHSVIYCFKWDLCDLNYVGYTTHQLIAVHRYSAIGRHLMGGGDRGAEDGRGKDGKREF